MRYIYILILLIALIPTPSKAANISFTSPTNVSLGEEILVSLSISSISQSFNAVSGDIVIPKNFSISHIYDGDSVVTVWVERPSIDKEKNSISFSGITPGGVKGDFKVISFVLKPLTSGSAQLKLENFSLLENDGKGTSIAFKINSSVINISKTTKETLFTQEDNFLPETFKPIISSNQDIFNGEYFISFSTNDKGVGLDHYEIATSFFFKPNKDSYKLTESPKVLTKLELVKKIYVKAVDRNGNERSVYTAGPYHYYFICGSLIALLLIVFIVRKIRQ